MKIAEGICGPEAKEWTYLLQKLYEFDQQSQPVGLYGIRDYQSHGTPHPPLQLEWERVLKPAMQSLGCDSANYSPSNLKSGAFRFRASGPFGHLRVVRLSKIKIRKYGNTYRVDPHQECTQRWKEAAVDSILHDLWKVRGNQDSLVLLIGFAHEEKPFADEINELQSTQTFGQRFQPALTKMWDDPHGRGFKVIAALWRVAAKQRK